MNQAPPQDGVTSFRAMILLSGDRANETRQRRSAKAVATLQEERT